MKNLFVGDNGTEIVMECGVDVSSATVRQIKARKPDFTLATWSASAGDTATQIKYFTDADDLDQAGTWTLQAAIDMPGWSGLGETVALTVKAPV
jgi:hypothetical protein